jgi:hypothetical protein
MAQLHSRPPSGMTAEQARAQVALHHQEAMEQMKRDPMESIKQSLAREAAISHAQLESGQTVSVDSKEQFIDLVRQKP